MQEEIESLKENQTWKLVKLPANKKVIDCKWVFKTKLNSDGEVVRHKARLVVRGFSQRKGIDYNETFSPVVKYTSIRFLFVLAARYKLRISQMDVVTAFLYGDLDEEIYMVQPEGFSGDPTLVCRLMKSLYGLKQASRQWNHKINAVLENFGFERCDADQCIYYMIKNDDILIVALYVDDFLIFSNNLALETKLKNCLEQNFKIKNMGEVMSVLGMKVTRNKEDGSIAIDQRQYIEKLLVKFGMDDCNPVATPLDPNQRLTKEMSPSNAFERSEMKNIPYQEAVGSLLFLVQISRLDICYAVSVLSRYNNDPGKAHWAAVKRVLRYLKGTIDKKLVFTNQLDELKGYCDADWASDVDERKSTSGYVFTMQGAAISWSSKKQGTIALSTTEAEYMSMVFCLQEAIWLTKMKRGLNLSLNKSIDVICDNKSAISFAKNGTFSPRTKHIDIKDKFIREKLKQRIIQLKYTSTNEMIADVLTKGLVDQKHKLFTSAMGLN